MITASLALCKTPEASYSHGKQSNGLQQVGQSEQRTCQVTWSHCFHRKGVPSVSFNPLGHTEHIPVLLLGAEAPIVIFHTLTSKIFYMYFILYYLYILNHITSAYLYIYIYTLYIHLWKIFMDLGNRNSQVFLGNIFVLASFESV